jgi:cytochrome P450
MKVNLKDPTLFARNEFWPVLAWLRANAPVYRHEEPDGPGFWVLSRHRDIVDAYSRHDVFSSRHGMRLDSNADAVSAVSQRMLIVSDPPEHTRLKRVLGRAFAAGEIQRLGHLVRRVVAEVMAQALAAGDIDVIDTAKQIPNHVVCALMGIPRADWEWIGSITTEAFEGDDEDERSSAHAEIFLFFTELLEQRRRHPGDDLVSWISQERRATDVTGEDQLLTDEEIVFNCNGILAGANETTRYSTAGGVLALAQNPDQWQRLRRGGPDAVPAAVEEILRWTTPGVHALRTVTQPTQVRDVALEPGDRVTLWNVSANRDEDVFADSQRFQVDRTPNRHITFGHGRHLCLGAKLARLELAAFLEELLTQVEGIELLGEPRFNASNFTWGLRQLPVRLQRTRVPV